MKDQGTGEVIETRGALPYSIITQSQSWTDMDMVDFVLFKGLCQKLDGYMLNAIVMMMMVVATSPTEISSTSGSNRRE